MLDNNSHKYTVREFMYIILVNKIYQQLRDGTGYDHFYRLEIGEF